jgi:hypothetical protein
MPICGLSAAFCMHAYLREMVGCLLVICFVFLRFLDYETDTKICI